MYAFEGATTKEKQIDCYYQFVGFDLASQTSRQLLRYERANTREDSSLVHSDSVTGAQQQSVSLSQYRNIIALI